MEDHAQPIIPEEQSLSEGMDTSETPVNPAMQEMTQKTHADVVNLVGRALNQTRSIHDAMYSQEIPQTLAT